MRAEKIGHTRPRSRVSKGSRVRVRQSSVGGGRAEEWGEGNIATTPNLSRRVPLRNNSHGVTCA